MVRKFPTQKTYNALFGANPAEGWRMAQEIWSRWQWVTTGNVDLPVERDGDLLTHARMALRVAGQAHIPVFPLAPGEYSITAGQVYNLIPKGVRGRFEKPADPKQVVIWGVGALGGVPDLYRSPEMGLRIPGTFWDAAFAAGGGESFDAVTRHKVPGYGFSDFEAWLLDQEDRVYRGSKLREDPVIWSGGDPLADRRIRAFFAGYRLDRSSGYGVEQVVWEATMLPIPALAWWIRYWVRRVDSGMWARTFAHPENRDRLITAGLAAINQHGGWPAYPDPVQSQRDWHMAVDFDGRTVPVQLIGPMLTVPVKDVEKIGNDQLDEFIVAAVAELTRFDFKVLPVTF